jgi:sigma-B regulation protein RsbU (phosphoserine phosphatase)
LVIADVSDKGLPAALFMALTRATLRANSSLRCCPGDCVTFTNRILCQDAADGMFVSMVYAELNEASGALTYVNAGHPPPFWYRHAQSGLVELESTGIAMGIEAEAEFSERTLQLQPGDFIFFYTDGVTDAANDRFDAFGKPRLEQLLSDRCSAPAQSIVETLNDALITHVGKSPQFDDISAFVIKRK